MTPVPLPKAPTPSSTHHNATSSGGGAGTPTHHRYHHHHPTTPTSKWTPQRRRSLQPTTHTLVIQQSKNRGATGATVMERSLGSSNTPHNRKMDSSHHSRTNSLPPRYHHSPSTNSVTSTPTASNTAQNSCNTTPSGSVATISSHPSRRHSTTSVEGYNTLHGLASLNGIGLGPVSSHADTKQNPSTSTPPKPHPSIQHQQPAMNASSGSLHSINRNLSIKGYSWNVTPLKRRSGLKHPAKYHSFVQKVSQNSFVTSPLAASSSGASATDKSTKQTSPISNSESVHTYPMTRPGTPVRQDGLHSTHADDIARRLEFPDSDSGSVEALLTRFDDETVDTTSIVSDTDEILTIMSLESLESEPSSVDFVHSPKALASVAARRRAQQRGDNFGTSHLKPHFPSNVHHMHRVPRSRLAQPTEVARQHKISLQRHKLGKRKVNPRQSSNSPSKLSIQGTSNFSASNTTTTTDNTGAATHLSPASALHPQIHLSPSSTNNRSSKRRHQIRKSSNNPKSNHSSWSSNGSNGKDPHDSDDSSSDGDYLEKYALSSQTRLSMSPRSSGGPHSIANDESIEDMSPALPADDSQSEGFEHLEDLYRYFGYMPHSESASPNSYRSGRNNILKKHDSYADLVKPFLARNNNGNPPPHNAFHQLET